MRSRTLILPLASLLLCSVSPTVLMAQQVPFIADGGNGADGHPGIPATPVVGGDGDAGGNGGSINTPNATNGNTAGQPAILGSANGGKGGDGGTDVGVTFAIGGQGGRGGDGGQVNITNSGSATSTLNNAEGVFVRASGGQGGNGGGAYTGGVASGGGAGGGGLGGTAVITNSAGVNTTGAASGGIVAIADGGGGGNGGTVGTLVFPVLGRTGGTGGNGGTATVNNSGNITTGGEFAYGILTRAAGGTAGQGSDTGSIFISNAGNGGNATIGGTASANNSGSVSTGGNFASGMVVQSVGGGGGNGGGTFGFFGGGGAGKNGNDGQSAIGTNTGTIITTGQKAVGILIESVGGGGGDGGGSIGVVALGGDGGGGGIGGLATGNLGGTVRTGNDADGGDGATGIIVQSVGGGGGNGGFALGVPITIGSVAIGGKGGSGGSGGKVVVRDVSGDGPTVSTNGFSATGILAQSVGGGGGNGGGAVSSSIIAVAIGGKGGGGGNAETVDYNVQGADVTTRGTNSSGIIVQSVGGGGGNGGFAIAASAFVSVGLGGDGGIGGDGKQVDAKSGANIDTSGDLSSGLVVQSVGGGGGNGGTAGAFSAGLVSVAVAVGGKAEAGGAGGVVNATHTGDITVRGAYSKAIIVQSVGGGGGNGGDAWAGSLAAGPWPTGAISVAVGGSGGNGGNGQAVSLTASGILKSLSSSDGTGGIVAQSIGGGGGAGGSAAALAGSLSPSVSINVGVSIGGKGAGGGSSGTVTVNTLSGSILVNGTNASGILAQSIGGGGGKGGNAWSASGGYGNGATVNASVDVGGGGGKGNTSEKVTVNNRMAITMKGDGVNGGGQKNNSAAIKAQSIGGGGGAGGSANGATASVDGGGITVNAVVSVGGFGGTGNDGGIVEVNNFGRLETFGQYSAGIHAQSIGGGGGDGGSSNADSFRAEGGGGTNISAKVSVGGFGAGGGNGKAVTVDNAGSIFTHGLGSNGILAMSIGGGGGNGGASSIRDQIVDLEKILDPDAPSESNAANTKDAAKSKTEVDVGGGNSISINAGLAGLAAAAGNAEKVTVTNRSGTTIQTTNDDSNGISAHAIGGSGGIGGAASGASSGKIRIGAQVGGFGGKGGTGGVVEVTNEANATIRTYGRSSNGILAQSIGGGGGNGGAGMSTGNGSAKVDLELAIGGFAADGGFAQNVTVKNSGLIETFGRYGNAIMAQSVGGSGGNAGASGTTSSDSKIAITFNLGGKGGTGGNGGVVTVENKVGGVIRTTGSNAYGVFAQSVGGGGGTGGAGTTKSSAKKVSVGLTIGGLGGDGNFGGAVNVTNDDTIATTGVFSHGVFAESIGGGGGASGAAANSSASKIAIGATGALPAGIGSYGGNVDVKNSGSITTARNQSIGIFAHSVGGSGGFGGVVTSSQEVSNVGVDLTLGGFGGGGGKGGNIFVRNFVTGDIFTKGDFSHGILAQSVGGGGGTGGSATSEIRSKPEEGGSTEGAADNPDKNKEEAIAIAANIGGLGGTANKGGDVFVSNAGEIITRGAESIGIYAESIGGGGGAAGAAGNKSSGKIAIGAVVSLVAGGGADGGTVDVENGGKITTVRDGGIGIFAHSVGGGGGSGGAVTSELKGSDFAIGFGLGGFGKAGGAGNTVTVKNFAGGEIITLGDNAHGIFAQSVGGGGGKGGTATTKLTAQKKTEKDAGGGDDDGIAINATLGGVAGDGSFGGTVLVDNNGRISTVGKMSHGIFAESIGGGGGAAGSASNTSTAKTTIGATASLISGGGADGGFVRVTNLGSILTIDDGSIGIFAHSVGGGGGFGGSASTESNGADTDVSLTMGGFGANGGAGGTVNVNNFVPGSIVTLGNNAHAIFAQSVGGGGGAGGASTTNSSAKDLSVTATLGGFGGAGTKGGFVKVENTSLIQTSGVFSHGVFAESIGGGGGASGATTQAASATTTIGANVGSTAGGGADGGEVIVRNSGKITTLKDGSYGVLAHSVGGGGGFAGTSSTSLKPGDLGVNFTMGAKGGGGGAGGKVTVTNFASGEINTVGISAYGIFAQSVGGGGGIGGAASIGVNDTEGKSTAVIAALGGLAGKGNDGGAVTVDNAGRIITLGDLAHGIFAESIGGGGGASGSASTTSNANMTIGLSASIIAGVGANGGAVKVTNSGLINTVGNGALGIFAQSVGGGGGFGGVSSADAAGDSSFTTSLGGTGAGGGDGGKVEVIVSGAIITEGERAHGVVAQSVGGAGGLGGDAKGKTNIALAIGGFGGGGGDGGNVTVTRTGTITTMGKDSVAIIAQSVGGGGGIGGAGFGRFKTEGDGTFPDAIGFNSPDGSKGTGGKVTITQTGAIETEGDRAHGIIAQAVGGSGGLGGTSSLALGQSGAGSNGGIGDANDVGTIANSQVRVLGASAYAMFGQSATGIGNAGKVDLTAMSNLIAQGKDSIAAYGESTSALGKNNITINLNGQLTAGGADTGVAAMLVGGVDNTIVNHSLTYATGKLLAVSDVLAPVLTDFSPLAFAGTYGNDRIENSKAAGTLGRIIGNVELANGNNSFRNFAGASFVGLQKIGLGGGSYLNEGLFTNEGVGVLGLVNVNGAFNQTLSGDFVTDIDLNTEKTDRLDLTGAGNFNGEAPLNFTSIDNLFKEYTVSRGSSMVDSGIDATTVNPTVGFDFKFRVDNGTDLVLFADKPSFVNLLKDPASGVTDENTFAMGAYLDSVEAAPIGVNPMARLINMLRFSPDSKTLGDTVVRLTPHYAINAYDIVSRLVDQGLDASRNCVEDTHIAPAGNCMWLVATPNTKFVRDPGTGIVKKDKTDGITFGALAEATSEWSFGGSFAFGQYNSNITHNGALLSRTLGHHVQLFGLAQYENGGFSVESALGGGFGEASGVRDTTVAQVSYIPGETVGGTYLNPLLFDGIANSVTYKQKTRSLASSTKAAYKFSSERFYVQPAVQFDSRLIDVDSVEQGSLAAMTLGGASHMFAVTPQMEMGLTLPVGDIADVRLFGNVGVRQSFGTWKTQGGFNAASGLTGVTPLTLKQGSDTPLYIFGGGFEFATRDGAHFLATYSGTKSKFTKQHSVSATMKVDF
jgi:hypothetical protein